MAEEAPQQTPPPEQPEDDGPSVLAVLVLLLSGKALADAVGSLAKTLAIAPIKALGILLAVNYKPADPPKPGKLNTAEKAARLGNLKFRATFIVKAAKRLTDVNDPAEMKAILKKEKEYFKMHRDASARRIQSAKMSDRYSNLYNTPVLGWYAVLDDRTSPDCEYLDGKNYEALNPPGNLHPGSRHPHCRCLPGPPFADAPTVRKLPARFGKDLLG